MARRIAPDAEKTEKIERSQNMNEEPFKCNMRTPEPYEKVRCGHAHEERFAGQKEKRVFHAKSPPQAINRVAGFAMKFKIQTLQNSLGESRSSSRERNRFKPPELPWLHF